MAARVSLKRATSDAARVSGSKRAFMSAVPSRVSLAAPPGVASSKQNERDASAGVPLIWEA
ncbi:hypothetical protein GCM10017620_32530 [Brevundimonas intermedia]|uniref:Uncharacterized protein n=1 Tax=Brevundimonas intermedia TaxID=74315 RepID=A0ABQ5TEB2_9CAUL|nr:hypothetical protein GCM10017620_32530 [Brevundimonas intermedia]